MIRIVSTTGLTPGEASRMTLDSSLKETLKASPSILSKLMGDVTRKHLKTRFPGSVHYAESCVKDQPGTYSQNSVTGEIVVTAAGATRAYHDVTILPKRVSYLTIPIHKDAYRHKAGDFNDLFTINGKNCLFRNGGGGIISMFALVKKVFQKQDPTILPSDQNFQQEIGKRFIKEWQDQFIKAKTF